MKKSELKIKNSESEENFISKKYDYLINYSNLGIATHKILFNKNKKPIDYIFLDVNPAFEKFTGLKRKNIINKKVKDVIPGIIKTNLIDIYGKVVLTGKAVDFEEFFPPLNRYYSIKAYKIADDQFVTIFEDISKTKEMEKKMNFFSIMAEQNPSLIILVNKKGEIEYVNKKFSELTGYSLEEVRGKTPRVLKSESSSAQMYEELWKTITSGNIWKGEFYNKKKNGKYYWASAIIAPIKNNAGEIINFLGMQEDITAKKEIENILSNKIMEMEKFQKFTVERELKMIELKKEVNALLKKQKEGPKYRV